LNGQRKEYLTPDWQGREEGGRGKPLHGKRKEEKKTMTLPGQKKKEEKGRGEEEGGRHPGLISEKGGERSHKKGGFSDGHRKGKDGRSAWKTKKGYKKGKRLRW